MYEPTINYLAILVTTLLFFMLRALWYSPVLFSKAWIKGMGLTEEQLKAIREKGHMAKPFIINFIGTFIMVFVTAHMVDFMKVVFGKSRMTNLAIGLTCAFWLWLGYIATFGLNSVSFEQKSWKLYFINTGYYFVGLMMSGAILALWV